MKWTQARAIAFMKEWKQTHPCVDCSARAGYPVFYEYFILEFDHYPGSKVLNLGTHGRKLSEEMLRIEISKCDVVCSNCHKIRTHARQIQPRKKS